MLEQLKRRLNLTGNDRDALLQDLLNNAQARVLSYTRRTVLPAALEGAVCELTAASYHLLGLEGEKSHAEGEVSLTVDAMPESVRAELDWWRIARVG